MSAQTQAVGCSGHVPRPAHKSESIKLLMLLLRRRFSSSTLDPPSHRELAGGHQAAFRGANKAPTSAMPRGSALTCALRGPGGQGIRGATGKQSGRHLGQLQELLPSSERQLPKRPVPLLTGAGQVPGVRPGSGRAAVRAASASRVGFPRWGWSWPGCAFLTYWPSICNEQEQSR